MSTESKTVPLKCSRCKNVGTATFSRETKTTPDGRKVTSRWHLDRLTGNFNHDENSPGGAAIYCATDGERVSVSL